LLIAIPPCHIGSLKRFVKEYGIIGRFMAEQKESANGTPPALAAQFQIGSKIKLLRLNKELRMADLAATAECSESLLSKIENGRVTPSLALLHRLATALGTTVAWLFTSENRVPKVVLRRNERPAIEIERFRKAIATRVERLTPVFEGALMQARMFVMEPGGHSQGDTSHSGEVLGFVVAGDVELSVDAEKYLLRAGDAFHFRCEQPHGFRNSGDDVAEVIWVNTPPTS
jgi:transcriptional regulator with XRE-family HTH domain